MSQNQIIPFEITSMDSLGQGVSKKSDKITFLPKTVVGDEGLAVITSQKKGVAFARVTELTKSSDKRVTPECPHYQQCPSCHYLHTDYDSEIAFKKSSLEKLFRKFEIPSLQVIPADRRFHYRNRIQLHYDLKAGKLGMFDPQDRNILPIPKCLIGREEVALELRRLYDQDTWKILVPRDQDRGHCEIYSVEGKVKVTWNRPYAEGGFTQVFQEMNEKLKVEIEQWARDTQLKTLLDLFAGNGNLSQNLSYSQRLCIDFYQDKTSQDFFSQDLYDRHALKNIKGQLLKKSFKPEHLLLDPPRSGMKDLNLWLEELKPTHVCYVSCDPHTLARDIAQLQNYTIKKLILIDFFPSTYHYETLILLERKR